MGTVTIHFVDTPSRLSGAFTTTYSKNNEAKHPTLQEKLSDTAKKNVLKMFPKAKCERDGAFFFVFIIVNKKKVDLGGGFSPEGAWCSAGVTVRKYSKKK